MPLLVVGMAAVARAQQPPAPESGAVVFPGGDVFQPLLADPKQVQSYVALLRTAGALETSVGAVALGYDVGLVRWPGRAPGDGVQVGLAAVIFSQFNLSGVSNELLNTDFLVGLPVTARRGRFSVRLRYYHQSSHLGDEYLLQEHPNRLNLSFEALELLVSQDLGALRLYAGGQYLVRRDPGDLRRGVAQGGVEWRGPRSLLRLGPLGPGRPILSVDLKAPGEVGFDVAVSAEVGVEFGPGPGSGHSIGYWSLRLQVYDGPVPYGQFYTDHITSMGLAVHLTPS